MRRVSVSIVRVTDDDTQTDDVWIDATCDDGDDVDVCEALGILALGGHLLLEQG